MLDLSILIWDKYGAFPGLQLGWVPTSTTGGRTAITGGKPARPAASLPALLPLQGLGQRAGGLGWVCKEWKEDKWGRLLHLGLPLQSPFLPWEGCPDWEDAKPL